MADDIQEPQPGQAVQSVTEVVPHEADASSAPGPYEDLSPDRPPVSTTDAQTPIAHSLVAGAGAEHTEGQSSPAEEHEAAQAEAAKAEAKAAKAKD